MNEYHSILRTLTELISEDDIVLSVLLLLLLALCFILPWFFLAAANQTNKIRMRTLLIPLIKAENVYSGKTLIQGRAESEAPLLSYISNSKCVWYNYYIQEQWKKISKTSWKDKKGRTRTKREVTYGWSPLYVDRETIPFSVDDGSGRVLVKPDGAYIHNPVTASNIECGPDHPIYFEKGPEGAIPNSTYKRRFVEEIIPLHHMVSVLGIAIHNEGGMPEISHTSKKDTFIISTGSKQEITAKLSRQYWLYCLAGFIAAILPLSFFIFPARIFGAQPSAYPFSLSLIILYLLALFLLWEHDTVRALKKSKLRATGAWKDVEALYKERQQLIPEMYRIANYYCEWENDPANDQASFCRKLEKGELSFDQLLSQYPILASGKIFLPLNRKLKNIESAIKEAKQSYDIYASHYNKAIRLFPLGLIHSLYGTRRLPLSAKINTSVFRPSIIPVTSNGNGQPAI